VILASGTRGARVRIGDEVPLLEVCRSSPPKPGLDGCVYVTTNPGYWRRDAEREAIDRSHERRANSRLAHSGQNGSSSPHLALQWRSALGDHLELVHLAVAPPDRCFRDPISSGSTISEAEGAVATSRNKECTEPVAPSSGNPTDLRLRVCLSGSHQPR
jgi:hypothetical protein